jgi:hypothetical protein
VKIYLPLQKTMPPVKNIYTIQNATHYLYSNGNRQLRSRQQTGYSTAHCCISHHNTYNYNLNQTGKICFIHGVTESPMATREPLTYPVVPVVGGSADIFYGDKPLKAKKMECGIFHLRAIN